VCQNVQPGALKFLGIREPLEQVSLALGHV
jgi:hypothetical protein